MRCWDTSSHAGWQNSRPSTPRTRRATSSGTMSTGSGPKYAVSATASYPRPTTPDATYAVPQQAVAQQLEPPAARTTAAEIGRAAAMANDLVQLPPGRMTKKEGAASPKLQSRDLQSRTSASAHLSQSTVTANNRMRARTVGTNQKAPTEKWTRTSTNTRWTPNSQWSCHAATTNLG